MSHAVDEHLSVDAFDEHLPEEVLPNVAPTRH
jgi:hypothetical protein